MKNFCNYRLSIEEIKRMNMVTYQISHKCHHCGKLVMIPEFKEKTICKKCGHYVFKNDKLRFFYYLKSALNNSYKQSKRVCQQK